MEVGGGGKRKRKFGGTTATTTPLQILEAGSHRPAEIIVVVVISWSRDREQRRGRGISWSRDREQRRGRGPDDATSRSSSSSCSSCSSSSSFSSLETLELERDSEMGTERDGRWERGGN